MNGVVRRITSLEKLAVFSVSMNRFLWREQFVTSEISLFFPKRKLDSILSLVSFLK